MQNVQGNGFSQGGKTYSEVAVTRLRGTDTYNFEINKKDTGLFYEDEIEVAQNRVR